MSEAVVWIVLVGVLLGTIGYFLGFNVGRMQAVHKFHAWMISQCLAEWRCDPTTDQIAFAMKGTQTATTPAQPDKPTPPFQVSMPSK